MDNRVHGGVFRQVSEPTANLFLSLWRKFFFDWPQYFLEILDHLVLLVTYSPSGLFELVEVSAIWVIFFS